jgi:alpha-amylase
MPSVCFYFQVHQPYRVKRYRVFDVGKDTEYFNDDSTSKLNNALIFRKVADKCYIPATKKILKLLHRHPDFKVSYSLSGVFMEQAEEFYSEVLELFYALAQTGRVEFLSETYYHSLAFLHSRDEFNHQVDLHRQKIKQLFDYEPVTFRNTELIYNNDVAQAASDLGFKTVIAEGADHVLEWRSPNYLYNPKGSNTKLLLKNYRLSDDIAFRFSSRDWADYPLTAPKFADWVGAVNGNGEVVNLFMDYETFGEHQWEDTGIFDFLDRLPTEILKHPDNDFVLPREAAERYETRGELDVPHFVSWADVERDLSAWLSNPMQRDAMNKLYALEAEIKELADPQVTEAWRRLQTSDHFYYMCTKWFNDGDVHKYFNPYESPYEAFISFMNALHDLQFRVKSLALEQAE